MDIVLVFRHVAVTEAVERHVTCERCRHEYRYPLERTAELDTLPLPFLERRAEQTCRDRVARQLAEDVEPVPCPSCGWMQSAMVPELRRRYAGWLRALGLAFAIASGVLAAAFLPIGIWYRVRPGPPGGLDLDWFGIAGVGAAGCGLGLLMILTRAVLGTVRYRPGGFAGRSSCGSTPGGPPLQTRPH